MEELEEWRDIVGYEGVYQVSNLGRIKALEKTVITGWNKVKRYYPETIKKLTNQKGYLQC